MSFDGVPRPSQLNAYGDAMNPYTAANAARVNQAGKPLVQSLNKEEKVSALKKEERQHHDAEDDEEQEEAFSEEEAEQLRLFAKMRGIMNFSLESGVAYEFHINQTSGMIDLVEAKSGKSVLSLTPAELQQLSGKIHRYAGMLTDASG